MIKQIIQLLKKNSRLTHQFCLILLFTIYLFFTLPALMQTHHSMRNLEPYPDGLLYSLAARNLALNGKLELAYHDSVLAYWVPPLYSLVLFIGYLFSSSPISFYFINLILGLVTLYFLFDTILKITGKFVISLLASLILLSHSYFLLLPTLPMSENLSLALFSVGVWALYSQIYRTISIKKTIVLIFMVLGLIFTKYAAITIAGTLLAIFCLHIYLKLTKRIQIVIGVFLGLGVSIFSILILNPFAKLLSIIEILIDGGNQYYSLDNITKNSILYFQNIGGFKGAFLWFLAPISSTLLFVIFFVSIFLFIKNKHKLSKIALFNILLFFGQFPILLIFYQVDARYILYTMVIFSLQIATVYSWLASRNIKLMILLHLVVAFSLVFQGKTIFKQIVASNLLGRSTAWQYQSVVLFDQLDILNNASLITALPPFLVDAYQTKPHSVLPLSTSQEFLAKKEYVWGDDVPYDNLITGYQNWLKEGKRLYITNAYITHQQAVIDDYEAYKKDFNFTLISEGCMEACNVYQLSLPDSATNSSDF